MPLDLQLLASKLHKYRNQFEASLDQVSLATGIPRDSLGKKKRKKKGVRNYF
jgi:hypothetical protein